MTGMTDRLSGKAKQVAGDITGNRALHREGRREELKGKAKHALAQARDLAEQKVKEAAQSHKLADVTHSRRSESDQAKADGSEPRDAA